MICVTSKEKEKPHGSHKRMEKSLISLVVGSTKNLGDSVSPI